MTCHKCNCDLLPSKAFVNVPTGMPDFHDGCFVTTMSYGEGKEVKLVDCMKCPSCGFCVRIKEEDK